MTLYDCASVARYYRIYSPRPLGKMCSFMLDAVAWTYLFVIFEIPSKLKYNYRME